MNIALAVLLLALLVSIGLNYSLWKKAEQQPDLIGLAVSLEWRARSLLVYCNRNLRGKRLWHTNRMLSLMLAV
jgi:hypothetical protein